MDFFTTEVWTRTGLRTYYVLFLIDLETRAARIAGIAANPGGVFLVRVARNLTDAVDGSFRNHRFVICDRDTCFTARFRRVLADAGVRGIRPPCQAPNCNACAEHAHQGLDNERIASRSESAEGEIRCRERLGGILKHYDPAA